MSEHAELIEHLGGGTSVAEAVFGGIGPKNKHRNVVYQWKKNGIPWRWRPAIARIAAERGVPVPPGFLDPAHERERSSSGQAAA